MNSTTQSTDRSTDSPRAESGAEAGASLVQAVREALDATGYIAFRALEIELCLDVVLLWGSVPTYHLKQVAQAAVQEVSGIGRVANGIEVACGRIVPKHSSNQRAKR